MGTYFQPEDLQGCRLLQEGDGTHQERYAALADQSTPFIASYWRTFPGFVNIPLIPHFDEFMEFERQADEGLLERRGYYAYNDKA